jgi:hypothetical protein
MSFGRHHGRLEAGASSVAGKAVTDHFQLTGIIAAAIRECRLEAASQQGTPPPQHSTNMEEDHRIAKAVLMAVTEAGFEICPKKPD